MTDAKAAAERLTGNTTREKEKRGKSSWLRVVPVLAEKERVCVRYTICTNLPCSNAKFRSSRRDKALVIHRLRRQCTKSDKGHKGTATKAGLGYGTLCATVAHTPSPKDAIRDSSNCHKEREIFELERRHAHAYAHAPIQKAEKRLFEFTTNVG